MASAPGAAPIKSEPSPVPMIKVDPDSKESPVGNISDEDIYEDTGDLDFTDANQDVWLMRVPKMLWENWSKLNDDDEIQIGTVRVEGGPTDIKRVRATERHSVGAFKEIFDAYRMVVYTGQHAT